MATRPAASLEVKGLTFRYPGAEDPALAEVDFHVEPGARVGLLGPNGAGKSTLMRLICGYLPIPAGSKTWVRVSDLDVRRQSVATRAQVGYLPEQVPLYQELRVREHLDFRATIKRVARRRRAGEIRRVCELAGLDRMLEVPIGRLSRGYRQRVGIADALLGSPPLVVLDEPTVGLDPNQVQGIRAMLRELGGAQTLIFSSHILAEVEALCDRIVILSRGHVVANESIREALASDTVVIEWPADHKDLGRKALESAMAVLELDTKALEVSKVGERTRGVVLSRGIATADVGEAIGRSFLDAGVPLVRLEPGARRLEERFARATGFAEDQS